jgi:hypothetical protein
MHSQLPGYQKLLAQPPHLQHPHQDPSGPRLRQSLDSPGVPDRGDWHQEGREGGDAEWEATIPSELFWRGPLGRSGQVSVVASWKGWGTLLVTIY